MMTESIMNNQGLYLFCIILAIVSGIVTMYLENYYSRKYANKEKVKKTRINVISSNNDNEKEELPNLVEYNLVTMLRINIIPFTIYTIVSMILFIFMTYMHDFKYSLLNLDTKIMLYTKMAVTPILLTILTVDYKKRIIPNRLVLILFEIITFYVVSMGMIAESNIIISAVGAFTGMLIFVIMAIFGRILLGKDGVGIGDIKLMGVIGALVGPIGILDVTLLAFILATAISLITVIIRRLNRNEDEYIAFAPFIVISVFASFILEAGTIVNMIKF